MSRPHAVSALILISFFSVLAESVSATTYVSDCIGTASFGYDANPNGVYPDSAGYGPFSLIVGDYTATLDYPTPEEGVFEWYLDPQVEITGLVLQQAPFEVVVNETGLHAVLGGDPIIDVTWEELGLTYVPGLGLYMVSMETPESFFPADPDRVLGLYDYDHEPDGAQDLICEITGMNGVHQLLGDCRRSATWMGLQGTGLPGAFADFVETRLPSFPAEILDQIRLVDLSMLTTLEMLIGFLGGPIPGNDVEGAGICNITVTITEGAVPIEESSWGRLKAGYR